MALASSVRLEIAGQEVPDFLDISLNQKMHGPHEFRVTCRMDTFETPDDFVVNNSKKFIGAPIVVEINGVTPGSDSSLPGLFFKGIIHLVRAIKSDLSNEDTIVLQGYSPEILLSDHPGCRSFENKTLGQIVNEVLKPYPRDLLNARVNPAYGEQIPFCVQYGESSLEFLQRLAARYGEWMYYNGEALIFGSPGSGQEEELALGEDLATLHFSLNMEATGVKYVSYDYLNAKRVETGTDQTTGKNQQNEVGKYAFDQSAKRFKQDILQNYPHLNVPPANFGKAQKMAVETDASARALRMSGIEATGENLHLGPGKKIKVKALKAERTGEIDYGKYLITTVEHHCDNLLNYENHFTAVPVEARIPEYANPGAVAHSGPQSAIVTDNKDPEKLGRVRVNFFWQAKNQMTPWIRVLNPYAANDRGFYFIPEIDDEVLVDFEEGDIEKPFVAGSLYHGQNKPHTGWPDNKNSFKGIVTKSKLRIEFDDNKKITTIDTPGGNKIVISDDEKSILLNDMNNNKVELSSGGIVLDSPKEIRLKAGSKIKMDGSAGVEIASSADVKISGLNIKQTADAGFTAQGNATAELSASGQTTVKGAMVMIN